MRVTLRAAVSCHDCLDPMDALADGGGGDAYVVKGILLYGLVNF